MFHPRNSGSTPKIGGSVKFAEDPKKTPVIPSTMNIAPTGIVSTAHIFSNFVIGFQVGCNTLGRVVNLTPAMRLGEDFSHTWNHAELRAIRQTLDGCRAVTLWRARRLLATEPET